MKEKNLIKQIAIILDTSEKQLVKINNFDLLESYDSLKQLELLTFYDKYFKKKNIVKSIATEKLLNILKWVKDKAEGKEEEKIINKTKRAVEKVEKVIEGNT